MSRREPWFRLVVPLLAGLISGCGMPFVMPPARVKLPGYQIASTFSEGLAVIRSTNDRKAGYVDTTGAIVIAPRFGEAGPFSQGLAPVRESGWRASGYIDRSGRTVIAPQFDSALPFAEGLAPVRLGGRWGYVDRSGALRIPAVYDDAYPFSEGRARVVVDGLIGFIDETGGWVAPASFFRAGDVHEGLAFVCDRSHCGHIDRSGRTVIALELDDAGSFSSGLAPVRRGDRWGYVDRSGTMAIAAAYDEAAEFSEGLARVGGVRDASVDAKFGGYSGRATFYGFIDPQGRTVFESKILGITSFSEGLAVVRLPSGGMCSDCYHYGLMRRDGEFLPGRFDLARPVSSGVAVVAAGDHTYVLDREGSPLIELDHGYPDDPSRTARHVVGVRYGFVDAGGSWVLPPRYTSAQPFSEGLALVEGPWERRSRLRGFVDRSGSVVVPVPDTIAQALPFTDGLSLISQHRDGASRYGFMNRAGEIVVAATYAAAAPFAGGLAAVRVSRDHGANDWGFIDRTGAFVIEPRFHAAGSFSNGLAYVEWVTKERYQLGGIIDRQGRVVVEKPYLPELSRMLFSTPSLEQLRQRREVVFGEGLVPRHDEAGGGWVDAGGRMVGPDRRFLHVGLFSEARAPVMVRGESQGDVAWGYAGADGALVVPPRFARAEAFSEGLASVRDPAGRAGYITPSGEWAIPPMWLEEAGAFSGGRALVKLNNHWGYLDRDGRFVIPPRYLRAEPFSEGLAVTAVATPDSSRRSR